MKTKSIIITSFMLIIFAYLVYALGGVTLTTPADDVYTASDNEVTFVCNGTAQLGYNITGIYLYTDTGGTWSIAYTDATDAYNNTAKGISYSHTSLTYGETLVWNCRVDYTHNLAAVGDVNASTYADTNKSVRVSYIGTSTLSSPADNFYPLTDTVSHTCNGTAAIGYNITSIALWTNSTGTWTANHVKTIADPLDDTAVGNVSTLTGLSDGTHYVYNCLINYTKEESLKNATINQSLTYGTANRTVYVELPPTITLNSPANAGYVSGIDTFNWLSLDAYGKASNNYTNCIVYTNLSTWTTYGPTVYSKNNTAVSTTLALSDRAYKWNVKCWEPDNTNIAGFSTSNYTFTVDTTNPTVSIDFLNAIPFANETWMNTGTIALNVTLTDINAQDCDYWVNVSGSTLYLNKTLVGLTTGIATNVSLDYADGNYTFYLACNDSVGNGVNSSQYEFRVDTVTPLISSITNNSRNSYCDQWNITVSSDENVNMTINYGTTTAIGTKVYETDYVHSQTEFLPDIPENTFYYFNVTVCDIAGNCNITEPQQSFTFPFKVCSGWTYLGIYENSINMSDIATQSGADYVYSWNQTNQEWFYYLGSGAGGSNLLSYGDEVMLYEATNGTWVQDRSGLALGNGYYNYTIYSGDNYIPLTTSYTFGSLSSALMNDSDSWGLAPYTELNGTAINFTWFDAYNNSILDWHGGYTYDVAYNWTWNNNTNLENSTGTEVVWFYSAYNSTDYGLGTGRWNGTSLTWSNGTAWK